MKTNTYLRYGILAGLALVLFTPLLVTSSMFFPFITGKNFAFRIIVELVAALWLILALRDSSARPKKSLILWGIIALFLATTVATIFSLYPYHSFWSNYERMDGLITQIHLLLYFLVVTGVLTTRIYWHRFFNLSLVFASCVSLYAVGQLSGLADIHQGSVRIDATLGNAAYMAVYMLIHLFLATYLAITYARNVWLKAVYWALAGWFTLLLYFTQTRGTILGLIGGLFIFGLVLAWRGEGKIKKIALGLLIGVILFVGSFIFFKDTSLVRNNATLNRFATISLTEATTVSRFTIWSMSLQAVKEHPLFGWGPENYLYVFSKYYQPSLWSQEPWFDRSHNVFLDWLISAGLIGLSAYLFLFGTAIYYLYRFGLRKKTEVAQPVFSKQKVVIDQKETIGVGILVALLVAYFIHNVFVFDNLISYILFFSLLGYVHTIVTENKKGFWSEKILADSLTLPIGGIALVLLAGSLYFINIKPIMASRGLIRAMSTTDAEIKYTEFKKVFALNTFGSREALEQYLLVATNVFGDQNVPVATKQKIGELALAQMAKETKDAGPDARLYLLLGSFMSNIGRFDESNAYLDKALSYSPKKQAIYFQLIANAVEQKNSTKALALAKQVYELDPKYREASLMYALVAIYSGQLDLADQILAKSDAQILFEARLLNAYNSIGRPDKVQALLKLRIKNLEQAIKTNPQDESNYLKSAEAWQTLGDKFKADEVLRRIIPLWEAKIKTDPDNKDNYISLAELYFRLGDSQKVEETISRVVNYYEAKIKQNPRSFKAYQALAEVFVQANRVDLAKQVMGRAISANPSLRYQAQKFLDSLPPAK
ncbi:MAG: hypothetical protein A2607_01185 [Candidatus Vogelbacteria bacterium RIFOXYD1_FULL_42_15]|uniref:O-antigen ligase-related domain-containing protein n=1 Tax=Candidatus Vogelbacteria bacterium RIFOXYD1_FULL_42_15 TaxID=1802437 RepID=A0A1G2QHG6_9BACT|nr:MAG: hypothetical protein A2607_01185 [Candidatus Vogelbacteria bacterium RIFOXYD1_FULL_42_15]